MEDSRKPLTAGEIEELKEEIRTMPHKEFFGENLQPLAEDHSRLLSILTPPPDAAVRAAVEHLSSGWGESAAASRFKGHVYTLIRAVQAISAKIAEYEAEIAEVKGLTRQCAAATVQDMDKADAAEAFAGEVGRGE